jgi:hypothetical protein
MNIISNIFLYICNYVFNFSAQNCFKIKIIFDQIISIRDKICQQNGFANQSGRSTNVFPQNFEYFLSSHTRC